MKNYLNLIQELTLAQRIKRGKAIKRKAGIIKRKRALSMRRPPSPEKMERGVKKAVRLIGFAVKDKSGKYKDASIYEKYGHLRHFAHYDTAWQIFKDYPIFGVGNSKFRYICHDKKYLNLANF